MSRQNRKSKLIRFRKCFRRGVRTESKCEHRNKGEKRRRATTYGPFITMYQVPDTHADYLALGNTDPPQQHARRQFDPGRSLGLPWRWWRAQRWRPGIKLQVIMRTNFQPHSRGHHAEFSSKYLRFGSKARTSRLLLWFACWLCMGGPVRLCCRASCGLCAAYGNPDVMFWRGCANQ